MFGQKVYHDALIVSFSATPPTITTDTETGEHSSYPSSNTRQVLPQNYGHNLVFLTGIFLMLE